MNNNYIDILAELRSNFKKITGLYESEKEHCKDLKRQNEELVKEVFNALLERERIGSTTLGNGAAIPHCRSNNVTEPIACLLVLQNHMLQRAALLFYQ